MSWHGVRVFFRVTTNANVEMPLPRTCRVSQESLVHNKTEPAALTSHDLIQHSTEAATWPTVSSTRTRLTYTIVCCCTHDRGGPNHMYQGRDTVIIFGMLMHDVPGFGTVHTAVEPKTDHLRGVINGGAICRTGEDTTQSTVTCRRHQRRKVQAPVIPRRRFL